MPRRGTAAPMMRVIHFVAVVAVNAVPLAGWFLADWSAGTTLAVYWFENLVMCLFVAIRIMVHRRLSPRRGHFRYRAPSGRTGGTQSSFLSGFLVTSVAFCIAHGVFLAVLLLVLRHNGEGGLAALNWRSVGIGCLTVTVFLIVDLTADLPRLRTWPFLRVEQMAYRGLGRIVVVHLTLIFGLAAVALTGANTALFGVFVVLKTVFAVLSALPPWEPPTPPAWFSRLMNRLPNVHPGKKFEDLWAEDRTAEAQRRDRNEEPWTAARR